MAILVFSFLISFSKGRYQENSLTDVLASYDSMAQPLQSTGKTCL